MGLIVIAISFTSKKLRSRITFEKWIVCSNFKEWHFVN